MKPYEIVTFAIFTALVAMLIYKINDETQPLIGILRPNYLAPTLIYSLFVITIPLVFHLLIRIKINRIISLIISSVIGLPLGLKIIGWFAT
jgi:hypothetical protein